MQDFPRAPRSSFNHIALDAIVSSARAIFAKTPDLIASARRDCAYILGLGDEDYDAALVRQAIVDRTGP